MTEQSILVYKLFLSDFSLFFVEKLQPPPPEKVASLFLSNPVLKTGVGGSTPPLPLAESGGWGGGAHYHQKP